MKIIALFCLGLTLVSTVTFAQPSSMYDRYLGEISKLESDLSKCIPDEDESYLCYSRNKKQYNKIIADIRQQYKNKVDSKVWQAINISFNKAGKACADPYFDSGKSVLHGLAVTTVELHLK